MRILFVQYTPRWTGPSKSLAHLVRGLGPVHEPVVALPGTGALSEALDEAGVRRITLPAITKWQLPRLAGIVRRERFDVVYANSLSSTARIGLVAARLGGAAFVCHVREMGWGKSWLRLGYLWPADAVVAVSEACGASVRRFVRRGRLHVVHNGVPESELRPGSERDRAHLRVELGLPPDARVILSVAHVCERKGQEHAVRALQRLAGSVPGVHLALVGARDREPAYVRRLEAAARSWGLEGRVHLAGFRQDAARLLRGADLVVHTAAADPHPRAVLEAMAAGRAVVAFDVDGVSETVVDGVTGRLVAPGDADALSAAIGELLARPNRAAAMGVAGRERVAERFTTTATTAGVLRVLDSLNVATGEADSSRARITRPPA